MSWLGRFRIIMAGLALLGGAWVAPASGQTPTTPSSGGEPGSELRVWLITIGPGDAIWERFGHNAIRLLDTSTGYDASYNWGIFDFQQEDFIPRFLRGEMLYMMAPFATEPMIDMYRAAGREVIAQELALTPAEKLELRDFAERNALPGNREYYYDYFLDNCSTRVRDLLDQVLGGAIFSRFGTEPTGTSYRDHTRRLTQPDRAQYTGMDILLGTPGDQPITVWAEMFLPMTLRDAIRDLRVDDGEGGTRPLVISEELLAEARVADEPEEAPTWWPWYLLIGLVGGGAFAFLGRRAAGGSARSRWALAGLGGLWAAVAGLAGLILVGVLFTDHQFMTWNENLFLLSPLSLVLAPLVPLAAVRPSAITWAVRVAGAVVVLAVIGVVIGLMPFAVQENALEIALFLPLHVGLWRGISALGASATG